MKIEITMGQESQTSRFHDLDALRAFAMLLGIVLHACMSFVALPVNVSATRDIYQNSTWLPYLMDAIHGFRMPLFFLVSGLFTAMLWEKRGLKGLLKHRFWRIGIPLLLGCLTIVPAVFVLSIGFSRNIWFSAARGDAKYVAAYISAGGNLDLVLQAEGIPGNGATPLHLATVSGQVEIARILLHAGANPNVPAQEVVDGKPSLATCLHWAAYAKGLECAQLLIDAGANLNARDASGQTPLDYARASSATAVEELLVASGAKLGSQLGAEAAQFETVESRDPLSRRDFLGDWVRRSSVMIQLWALLTFFPVFAHLWFLWYLVWLVVGFCCIVFVRERMKWQFLLRWKESWPAILIWAFPLTYLCQLVMVQGFGPDTAAGLVPWPPTLGYYGMFFAVGACLHTHQVSGRPLGRRPAVCMLGALVLLPVGLLAFDRRPESFWFYQAVGSVFAVGYTWCMIAALFGIFRKLCSQENATVRYLSDASYWIYLIHLPIVNFLQIQFSPWEIPGLVKLLVIVSATFAISLITYHFLVRGSLIGVLLNGRKTKPVTSSKDDSRQDSFAVS